VSANRRQAASKAGLVPVAATGCTLASKARWCGAIRAGFPNWDADGLGAAIAHCSLAPLAIESKAMTLSEIYLARAATFAELAKSASSRKYKERIERMALAYKRVLKNTRNQSEYIKEGPTWDDTGAGWTSKIRSRRLQKPAL